ncbi:DUF1840 domain-containing protein [Sulfurivermis fontis]|jgi:hypothetical protein|uniref:DUF1840 domain-containing protein n=1 Tax=Sulfurivermis fontis TaxID=1972068 RepID=UPI000FDA8435|nr:DUF1840 domain-containing protein [Sulfurivermis fontis]
MLVTFHSRAYADITLFGDVAKTLLKMMGHSGTVPGALLAEDIPAALTRLRAALAAKQQAHDEDKGDEEEDEEKEAKPPLDVRALPLVELLEASARRGCDVMWD